MSLPKLLDSSDGWGCSETHWNRQPDGTWLCQETGEVRKTMDLPNPPHELRVVKMDGKESPSVGSTRERD